MDKENEYWKSKRRFCPESKIGNDILASAMDYQEKTLKLHLTGKEYTELESDRMARFASRYLEAARLVIRADLPSKPHCQRVLVPFHEKETREARTEFQSDIP